MSFSFARPEQLSLELEKTEGQYKFGTFYGVYVPSVLMMFGVIIFLRLGWIVGNSGLYSTLMIVTLAALITLITTLSLSASATNSHVGKGGLYYMISRSLGIEIGSAIGIPLFLRQCIGVSFCIVGFAESFHDLWPQFSLPTIGLATLIVLTVLTYTSANLALKVQIFIFVIMIASLVSLFTGGEVDPQYVKDVPLEPLSYSSFWKAFAIFFPAMTGIESSVSLSGDLKNPSRSLPLGTVAAVVTAYAVYMLIPVFLWQHVPQSVLMTDSMIVMRVARFESLIILGIWGATLSSALGALLGAPRTMQALAEDGILPKFFGREFGPAREPRTATCVTFAIASIGVTFGSINVIAPILTMIVLICYGTLNLATGLEDLMGNPSWRPSFRLPWPIAILGAVLCVIAMLMIDAGSALIAALIVVLIYVALRQKNLQAAWDDIRYGVLMFFARFAIFRLVEATPSSRSWRPSLLVFTGKPTQVSDYLLTLSSAVTQTKGFLTIASFLFSEKEEREQLSELKQKTYNLLKRHRIQALVQIDYVDHLISGMKRIIYNYGIGPLKPNTIILGAPDKEEISTQYGEVIKVAYERGRNIVLINENGKEATEKNFYSERKEIHIWWDDQSQANSELLIILAHMLQRSPHWKKSPIILFDVIANEHQKFDRQQRLEEFLKQNRLSMQLQILVSSDKDKELFHLLKAFSSQASMAFLGMRPPLGISQEDYSSYLQTLSIKDEALPPLAWVLNGQKMHLNGVLQTSHL